MTDLPRPRPAPVTEVDHDLRMQFFMMNPPETEALLADYTARVQVSPSAPVPHAPINAASKG